jgi:23S rRNA (guanosine2251-2'-O)-methyltransferase
MERLYGIHPILEALRSQSRQWESIMLQEGRRGRDIEEILTLAKNLHVRVEFRPRLTLDRLAGVTHHQGAVGVVAVRSYMALDDLLASVKQQADPLLILLDGIEDPHNLGAILRTAESAGAHGIILPERRSVGLTAVVAKASAGAIEHLPVARVVNLAQTIDRLKAEQFWTYALEVNASRSYLTVDYHGPIALVLGGEGRGVRSLVAASCDERVSLPMKGRVSSLNVSVAAGVLLYEVLRQRTTKENVRRVGSE